MLEQVMELTKQQLGDQSNHQEIAGAASQNIIQIIQNQVASGDISSIQEMLSGKATDTNSPVAQNLASSVSNQLSSQFNLSASVSSGFAEQAIGMVMNMLNNKVAGQQGTAGGGGLDVMSLVGQFMGGGNKTAGASAGGGLNLSDGLDLGDIASLAGQFLGGNNNTATPNQGQAAGGFDLMGLVNMFMKK